MNTTYKIYDVFGEKEYTATCADGAVLQYIDDGHGRVYDIIIVIDQNGSLKIFQLHSDRAIVPMTLGDISESLRQVN